MTIPTPDLNNMSRKDLLKLNPEICKKDMTKKHLEAIFMACDAFWHHPGEKNPTAPHAKLTSGKHSNIYINCTRVLQRSNLCQIMAYQLLRRLSSFYNGPIDWVIGSDSAALGLSKDIANLANAKWHAMQKGPDKTQIWEKATIMPEEHVLHVEELLTTNQTTKAVRTAVREGNPYQVNFIPYIPVLVLRPDKDVPDSIDGSKLFSCLYYDTYVVDPEKEECEFCKNGSSALSPKNHWDELMETM